MPFKQKPELYNVWQSMRERCRNPKNRQWKDYGGRGITICPEWDDYAVFAKDMGPRPDGYTLDRIDNDGNYTPINCRWATRAEQARNQRVTRRVSIEGQSYLAVELADLSGLKTDTIIERAQQGLSFAEVTSKRRRVFTPGLAFGGKANGARAKSQTHCKNGHEFTPENTLIRPEGWRSCRTCRLEAERRRRP